MVETTRNKVPQSHPSRVRGLKLGHFLDTRFSQSSHPSRVRGLKRNMLTRCIPEQPSHPSRVRGLKRVLLGQETCTKRRTPHGCVD